MRIGLIILGGILVIPFIVMLIQLAIRDAKGFGYCDSLFDAWPIPILFSLCLGIALIIGGLVK